MEAAKGWVEEEERKQGVAGRIEGMGGEREGWRERRMEREKGGEE